MKKIYLNESQIKQLIEEEATVAEINKSAKSANTHPTEKQKKAGNYKMAHVTYAGFKITIENPKGSKRYWTDENGKKGFNLMHNHYGYFSNTMGKDGDQIDVFLGPNIKSKKVFPIDQNNKEGEFDETKVMLGFNSKEEAKKAYLSNFTKGWKGFRDITEVDIDFFKKWLYDGMKQQKPFAEYYSVKKNQINESKQAKEKSGLEKFFEKHGIKPQQSSIGFSEKEQKWYGWSHRAIYGFGIGSKVKKGDCAYNGKEWTAKTLDDAKQMAKDFQKGVD